MKKGIRILIATLALLVVILLVLGIDSLQRGRTSHLNNTTTPLPPGSVPIYYNGELVGGCIPAELEKLPKVSFTDVNEGVVQEGWLLRDVLLLVLSQDKFTPDTLIVVSSSSRKKSAQITWADVQLETNKVMFDLSNRGTLKLVSQMPELDQREEWVQDVDRIEVLTP